MHKPPSVCVVMPAYNEARYIETAIREVQKHLPTATLVVVDNASTDGTAELALALGAIVISEGRPGKGLAVTLGVSHALAGNYDWIALHDADNEYCAKDLASLIVASQEAASPGPLMGVGLRQVTLSKVHWRSLVANWVARKALCLAMRQGPLAVPLDILTGTRVFNNKGASVLWPNSLASPFIGFELETALTRRALKAKLQLTYAPVRYTARAIKEKKINAWHMIPILRAAFKAS